MLARPVTYVPSIGEQTAKYFTNKNINQATQIFGMFLYLGMDEMKFKEWLSTFVCNVGQQQQIYSAMLGFAQQHM